MSVSREDFDAAVSARQASPAIVADPFLHALYQDFCDDWNAAHDLVQDYPIDRAEASWIHAYLHRKEGDLSNAGYWYRCAQRSMPSESLDEERESLLRSLLERC